MNFQFVEFILLGCILLFLASQWNKAFREQKQRIFTAKYVFNKSYKKDDFNE